MALLSKRPLAGFCILFFAVSLAAGYLPVLCSVLGAICFGGAALVLFLIRALRSKWFTLGLCFAVVCLSLIHSFTLTELPRMRAEKLVGQRTVLCEVIEEGEQTSYSMSATVRILNVDGEDTHIKGYLVCDFPLDADVGDQLYAYASVEEYEEANASGLTSRKDGGGRLLSVFVEKEEHGTLRRLSERPFSVTMLFSASGIRILADRVRDGLCDFLCERLGEEVGALANGFFVGDTSMIYAGILRDFRRAGIYHLLSVSGLHLTILLGSIEWILRCLYVPKKIRIVAVSFGGVLLLILTGFAASACRAVTMLWLTYLQFMLMEEYDGITALFTSAVLILLVSPYATNDLGLWMSFQATLGLLSLFPLWNRALWEIKAKGKVSRVLWRGGRSLLSGVLLTSVANLFLLPILWYVFGELSWVALICNAVISPLASAFLVAIPLGLLFGWIPLVGEGIFSVIVGMGRGLIRVAEIFSRFPNAMISLRYGFCAFIVIPLAVAMVILLLVRLRRRWLLVIPPLAAIFAFTVCLSVQTAFFSETEAVYLCEDERIEMLSLQEDNRLVICDLSYGGAQGSQAVRRAYSSSVSTELYGLVLTHLHSGHLSMLSQLSEQMMIRRLYLPMPTDLEEARLAELLIELSNEQGISVECYESGEAISFGDGTEIHVERSSGEDHDILAVSLSGSAERLLYLSPNVGDHTEATLLSDRIGEAETVILGCHGSQGRNPTVLSLNSHARTETVLFGSRKVTECFSVITSRAKLLVPDSDKKEAFFSAVLS